MKLPLQKNISFALEDVEEIPDWADVYPENKFTVAKCCFLSTRENSHGLEISEKVLRECASSILGNFLVAKISWGDATTHVNSESIYGYFPMEQDIQFVEDEDGILKAYAYAVISKRYSKEFNGIFEYQNLRDSSVEMTVTCEDDNEDVVTSFDIYGLTCLGKTVNGSCPDADIKLVRFEEKMAEKYFKKHDILSTLKEFVEERKQQMAEKRYKIDKSKESMSTKPWGDVDKTDLRNKIMEASNKSELVKACYMLVEDGWEDAPSEHLKYPVMCFEGDKLVYNRYGLSSALAYAKQENETSVINKIKAIYKKLDIDDDSERKEEKDMAEIEFSAVNIGDLWGKLYTAMRDLHHWEYSIKGIYEQDNQKFAVVYDDDMKLYRLNFSLTEEGLSLSDEIIEVKEEFIETDNMKKFAEPENVSDYRKENKEDDEDSDSDDKDEEEDEDKQVEEMSISELQEKISKLEKDVEDRDNIIMKNNEELETLREFKKGIDEQEKAKVVNSLMEEVEKFLDPEMMKSLRDEGMKCELCDMDAWSNKVKAMSFSAISKSKKKNSDIWSFSAPISNQKEKKSNSVWDRI
ncbi:MAG: hypothetical protein U0K83_00245 [Bacteroidales bacterium]|nr:hypothetical protein [Bacteroidales bacterium]